MPGPADVRRFRALFGTLTIMFVVVLASTRAGADLEPTNHFQCYDLARTKFDRVAVDLADDFGSSTAEVRRPRQLCAPVDKNGEDPTAPDDPDHLMSYQIRRTSVRFEGGLEEVVIDQFGALVLDLTRPDRLLVPTAKNVSGPAAPLDPPVVDHYQCYRVQGDRRRVPDVSVKDQFTPTAEPDLTDVKKPVRLCLPVDKNGEGILDNAARLMCYRIKPGPRVNREVWFQNQFGGGIVEARRARELCVPVATPTPAVTPTPTATPTVSPTPTATATPVCGNGIVEAGEECEGAGDPCLLGGEVAGGLCGGCSCLSICGLVPPLDPPICAPCPPGQVCSQFADGVCGGCAEGSVPCAGIDDPSFPTCGGACPAGQTCYPASFGGLSACFCGETDAPCGPNPGLNDVCLQSYSCSEGQVCAISIDGSTCGCQ